MDLRDVVLESIALRSIASASAPKPACRLHQVSGWQVLVRDTRAGEYRNKTRECEAQTRRHLEEKASWLQMAENWQRAWRRALREGR